MVARETDFFVPDFSESDVSLFTNLCDREKSPILKLLLLNIFFNGFIIVGIVFNISWCTAIAGDELNLTSVRTYCCSNYII